MGNLPQQTVRVWQWPNVLALDAALIAVLWQAALASAMGLSLSIAAHLVLGLSVWLSYTADRLFDVARRDASTLLSVRHRFAKRRSICLWRIWAVALIINLVTATQLSSQQIKQGGLLLLLCLLYTALNQNYSKRFFPKEPCVAILYAGGAMVFLSEPPPPSFVALFAYLCLLNCLMIGAKETSIDAQLRIYSVASRLRGFHLSPLIWLGAVFALLIDTPLPAALSLSFILLGLLNVVRKGLSIEVYRVLADSLLTLGPVWVLLSVFCGP
jgi:hypothetical protein